MEINNLRNGVLCFCGRHHSCGVKHVVIEKKAISALSNMVQPFSSIFVVVDENTFAAAGAKTLAAIADKHVSSIYGFVMSDNLK